MNRTEAHEFAENWISAWNRRDVDAVLAHYAENVKFVSPKAATFVGNPVVNGKKALSRYWHVALEKIAKIEFKLDQIVWDSESNELVIFYEAKLNGVYSRACESMKFDSSGRQVSGEAMYGAAL
jgi:ketosteroid isomerase-like protein